MDLKKEVTKNEYALDDKQLENFCTKHELPFNLIKNFGGFKNKQ